MITTKKPTPSTSAKQAEVIRSRLIVFGLKKEAPIGAFSDGGSNRLELRTSPVFLCGLAGSSGIGGLCGSGKRRQSADERGVDSCPEGGKRGRLTFLGGVLWRVPGEGEELPGKNKREKTKIEKRKSVSKALRTRQVVPWLHAQLFTVY